MLTLPPLPLPTRVHAAVFRALDSILRNSPDLRPLGITWRSWEGRDDDTDPPTLSGCPWVRLTPLGDPAQWETEGQHFSPMIVKVEVALAGTRAEDPLNFWAALVATIFPGDRSVFAALETAALDSAGGECRTYTVSQPSWSPTQTDDGWMWAGEGAIRLGIYITTRV